MANNAGALKFDLNDLLDAHKHALSQEYNVSVDLPDEEFFSTVENLGKRKIEELKSNGEKFLPHANMSDVLQALELTEE